MNASEDLTRNDLVRFRAAVLEDAELQEELQASGDLEAFIPHAIAAARARGLSLPTPDALRQVLRDDPLGLARWSGTPPDPSVPQKGWLPIQVLPANGELCVDWAYFGAHPLVEPFFEDSIRTVLRRPLNRLARHRTRLADLPDHAAKQEALVPSGFIFHMSRCGSTLVAQMLAADPRNVVISEASPLDAAVHLAQAAPPTDAAVALLKAMVLALGQRRSDRHERYFVKLDSWHTLSLPLFRRAFPSVPWVFLYREPIEVLASQMLQRGIQTVPEYLPPALFGLAFEDSLDAENYCAQVLSRTCAAVVSPYAAGGGRLINYNHLPEALWTDLLPHFGVPADKPDRVRMLRTAQFDAKTPGLTFSARTEAKRRFLSDSLRAASDRHLRELYRELETLRLAN